MIDTIIFDMGGTLEDIWNNQETAAVAGLTTREILAEHGLVTDLSQEEFWSRIDSGMTKYKRWSEVHELELKPEFIWGNYVLKDFHFDETVVHDIAETLADNWEVTYYHRELRPHVQETLAVLQARGYRTSVISNTASLYSVFNVLNEYGIRSFFEDITLSSITGYRKPNQAIFEISLRQLRCEPPQCAYVGDTISRDIIGAHRAGFGKTIQILSHLTTEKDSDVAAEIRPNHRIKQIDELLTIFPSLRSGK